MSPELLKELEPYLERLVREQDIFSYNELVEICEERYHQIGKKTKESNKLSILLKYLSVSLEIDLVEQSVISRHPTIKDHLATLPKWLLQGGSDGHAQPVLSIVGLCKQL
jgi:hypothetical protein